MSSEIGKKSIGLPILDHGKMEEQGAKKNEKGARKKEQGGKLKGAGSKEPPLTETHSSF